MLLDEELLGEVAGAETAEGRGGVGGRGILGVVRPVLFGSAVAVELATATEVDSELTIIESSLAVVALETIWPLYSFDRDAVVAIGELPVTNVCRLPSQGQESGLGRDGYMPCCSAPVQQIQLLLQTPSP